MWLQGLRIWEVEVSWCDICKTGAQPHGERAGENESQPEQAGGKQEGQAPLSSSLCFIQTLTALRGAHPHWEGQLAVLGPWIQTLSCPETSLQIHPESEPPRVSQVETWE